jgi:NAD(P)H-hydrate epimerase
MNVFTTSQIRDIDNYTIKHEPVASIDLMERAAAACVNWLNNTFNRNTQFLIFAGPGNNGGDGWAIARLLAEKGYIHVRFFLLNISTTLSADSGINRDRLIQQNIVPIAIVNSTDDFPEINEKDVVIDALFGSGLGRPLTGIAAALVKHINAAHCRVVSIDIPSGLMGEDNSGNDPEAIIRADYTLSFQFPKIAFFFAENENYTGRWFILNIGLHPEAIEKTDTPYYYLEESDIRKLLKPRRKFSHKGTYGHALLIAGSYGMMGAAVLASKACLRSGAGLVSAHIPVRGYEIMQSSIPEAIISIDPSEICFSKVPDLVPYNAIGVGPGIGMQKPTLNAIKELFTNCTKPAVIDADALNLISLNKELIKLIPKNSIITPHPKEFERLAGKFKNGYERLMNQIEFSKKYQIIVILKGAFTTISLPDGRCYFNSTGNPGMATGGSGDVLTGIIVSLLAQGYEPAKAAITGVFLHGQAGDIAASRYGYEALIASDIIAHLSDAFIQLNKNTSI